MTNSSYTTNIIYLGNFAQTDTDESNYSDENAAAVLTGQSFTSGDMSIVTATFQTGGDNATNDDENCGEDFTYNAGSGVTTQTLDSTTVAIVTVTAPDGSTQDIQITLIQAQNGDLFMSDFKNLGDLDNLEISAVEIKSFVGVNYSGYYAYSNVENTTIVPLDTSDGTVDGEDNGEVMGLGYDDANAPNDQGGDVITNDDDVIFGNGGDDSIDGAGGNDTIYGDNVVGSNGYAQGELLVNGALEAGVGTGGQQYNADVEGWTSGAGAFEVWGSGFKHETSQDGGNFVELDRGGEVDQISQDVTTVGGSTYTLTVDAKQRIEGSDDQVEVYFGGTLVGVIQPGDEWQTFEFEVTGSGSDTLTLREPSSDNNSFGPLIDNVSLVGDIPGTDTGVDGADTIVGNDGDDTIYGGGGNDVIYGDDENGNLDTSGVDPVELNFSDVEPGSETAGTANTATAGDSVVYNNVATLEDGTQVSARLVLVSTSDPALQVDLASEEDYEVLLNANNDGTMNGETATFRLEFFDTNTGDPVELEPSVVFADLDQNVGQEVLSITDPNLVNVGVPADSSLDVTYTPGGSLTAAGTEDNVDPNDPDSQIATVFGETSEIEFTLTSRGVNSGLNFGTTDGNDFDYIVPIAGDDTIDGDDGNDIIYGGGGNDVIADGAGNDSIFGGEGNDIIDDVPGTPNDSLGDDYVDGGEGDDTIYTGLGNDTLIGGEGDDLLSGEDGDDVIDGGEGNDLVYGGEGNDVIDTSNPTDPLPDLAYPGLWPADSDPSNDLDTVFGGAGNDTILTGDDADYIDAGEGDNYVDGGIDEDTIITGSGNDTVIGGEGDDTITTGAGDDLIYGGLDDSFPDAINIPDADGDLVTNNGQDTIDAGAGNDTVFGKDDDDVIYGGDGDDYLDGGVDEDEIYGGADSDTIIGGEAADQLFGGTGSDTFFGGTSGDVVVGGEDADNLDQDVLDLTGSNVDFITYTSPDNEDGVVTFDDGSTMTFSEIENVIPCFTPGTLIATARGERPVEDLQVGDRIITRDNGIQEIAWVGHKQFQSADLVRNPHLKPVLIKAGSLGNDLPERDMLVSPNHRLLVASDMTQLYFEESEVLAAAKHMVGSQGIHRVDVTQTTYIHFMFERHEVVLSDGAWTESFQPGDYSLKGIGNRQRNEIFELFPELREKQGLQDYQAARKSLKKHEAKLLVR